MTLRHLPPGTVIERAYYSVPQHATLGYTTPGNTHDDWDAAVVHAQGRRGALAASLTASLGEWSTPDDIAAGADAQVRVDLRWVIRRPDGATEDTVVESYQPVTALRTHTSFTSDMAAR